MKPSFVFCIAVCLLMACTDVVPPTSAPTEVEMVPETAVFTPTVVPTSFASLATYTPLPTPTPTLSPVPTTAIIDRPVPELTVSTNPVTPAVIPPAIWTTIGTPMPVVHTVLSPENITQIQEIGRWGKGVVIDATYIPDGTQLVVATPLGVYVYDAETAVQLSFIPVENIQLSSMAVSPDGQWVAMGIEPDQVEVRQLRDGSLRYAFTAPDGVKSLMFTHDGQHLLAPYTAWRLSDGMLVPSSFDMSTLSDNGKTVALYMDDAFYIAALMVEDEISASKTGVVIPDEFDQLTSEALSPDGQLLARGGWGDIVAVYQVNDGTLLYTLNFAPTTASILRHKLTSQAHNNSPGPHRVSDLEFTPDSQMLAVVSGFQEATLWQMSDGRLLQRIPGVNGQIAFSADGTRMAAWSDTLTQWEMPAGTRLNQLKQHMGWVTDLAFTSSSSHLAIASNLIYLRSMLDGGLLTSLSSDARSLAISQDDTTLLSTSGNELSIWNLADDTSFSVRASESSWGVGDVAISADGQMAATVSHDDAIRVWRVNDGQLLGDGYSMSGQTIAFSPTEPLLAFSGMDGEAIELWSAPPLSSIADEQGVWHDPLYSLKIEDEIYATLKCLAFSPDGTILAAGLSTGRILVWRIAEGALIQILQSHLNSVNGIAFSPDGQLLASVSYDGSLKFWRMADGVLLNTILFPPMQLRDVAFSPDGRFLATGSEDGLVRVWGVP